MISYTTSSVRPVFASFWAFKSIRLLVKEMLNLLKEKGYKRASLAVQKANYAVKMYQNVGFKVVDENDEEYIMVCEL